ncbi:hypothetical protein CR513_61117, partial [Mucuna pruriens]
MVKCSIKLSHFDITYKEQKDQGWISSIDDASNVKESGVRDILECPSGFNASNNQVEYEVQITRMILDKEM